MTSIQPSNVACHDKATYGISLFVAKEMTAQKVSQFNACHTRQLFKTFIEGDGGGYS